MSLLEAAFGVYLAHCCLRAAWRSWVLTGDFSHVLRQPDPLWGVCLSSVL